MKLAFFGAAGTVTGSRFLLTTHKSKVLVDCGLFQGYKELRLQNWEPFPVTPDSIDAVVLTHAHIDHTGYLPILVRDGFRGPIFASEATRDLCQVLLEDAGRIQEEEARRANLYGYSKHTPALPLFTEEDAKRAMMQVKTIPFGEKITIGDDLTVLLSRAGHILGSAILTFRYDGKTLVFTGDLGRPVDPIMQKPAVIQKTDYLVLESTYGGKLHPEEDPLEKLGGIIRKTAAKGGTVLIPSFAVGRAQKILYLLYELKKQGRIPDIPIYLDSPMAEDASHVMEENGSEHLLSKEVTKAVFELPHYIQSPAESKTLHAHHYPQIIIAGSGMIEGGRILHHIRYYGPHHENAIVFAGFQAPMTRGDRILSGARQVKIHGEEVPIRARVDRLESLSSHADCNETIDWLRQFASPPRLTFLVHGEPDALEALKEKIESELGWRVEIPAYLEEKSL